MTDYTHGSQSKPVVAAATAFMGLLALYGVYMLITGPSPDSVFRIYRSPFTYYPIAALIVVVMGYVALLGIKRLRNM